MAVHDLIGSTAYAKSVKSLPRRFAKKIAPQESGCIEWTGSGGDRAKAWPLPYGQVHLAGRMVKAHHAAWFLRYGEWPPVGKILCHRCDNARCVNVDHLFLGTHADNAKDRDSKGRGVILRNPEWCSQKGEVNPSAKLTPAQIDAIRSSDEGRAILADRYGVRPETIWRIRTGRLWAERQSPCTV